MVCADSESDTTLTTEVGQCMSYLAQGGHSTGASKDVCAIFYPLLELTSLKKRHVCVQDSGAEGTWTKINKVQLTLWPHIEAPMPLKGEMIIAKMKHYNS